MTPTSAVVITAARSRPAEVLEELRAQVAVIPIARNTYGHPAPATLAALRATGRPRGGRVLVADVAL